jgi:uncharacterized protein
MKKRTAFIIVGLVLSASVLASAAIEPAPKTYVDDRAGVIDSNMETRLIGLLQELEQKTGARVIVLTVNSTDGESIFNYSFERADQWKFGANQKSASVLVVAAIKDRKYQTQVGYDWEGVLTDGVTGTVARTYFVPNFKAGNYGKGLFEGTAAMAKIAADSKNAKLTGMPKLSVPVSRMKGRGTASPCCGAIFPLILIWLFLNMARRGRGGMFWGLLGGMLLGRSMGGSRGGFGSFGGGGGGGGGFGSFGGGGGGGFGGGGSGGSW